MNIKSCPVCNEQFDQCLNCASYVIDGERIYYEKLKDFGAVQDHEVRFIQRIQRHRTTAFFHNGKLYIPSRQGRVVPLAIGLQWETWIEQQVRIDELKTENLELLEFNEGLDQKYKKAEKLVEKYSTKVGMIASLLRDCSDQDMTLKTIKTVVERVGES